YLPGKKLVNPILFATASRTKCPMGIVFYVKLELSSLLETDKRTKNNGAYKGSHIYQFHVVHELPSLTDDVKVDYGVSETFTVLQNRNSLKCRATNNAKD